MARILVTGATGFVGTHLLAKLLVGPHEVFTASTQSGDVADDTTWNRFPAVEIVVHLAAKTFVPDSWVDASGFLRTNVCGVSCALHYCRKHDARLIFLSSYLYGIPDELPIRESAALRATNPYALSKKLAEETCGFFSEFCGVDVTVLRPFNIYGPGQDAKFLIPSIVEQVLAGEAIKVKDLEPKRDYLYIDDLTDALLRAIEKPQHFGIFNIGSGTSYSVREVIALIQGIANTNLPVRCEGERRKQEVMDTLADISRAREILGWRPNWSLTAGCAKVLENKKA